MGTWSESSLIYLHPNQMYLLKCMNVIPGHPESNAFYRLCKR